MREIPFSILKEDYEASSKEYCDLDNCPFNKAVGRQLPELGRVKVTIGLIYPSDTVMPDNTFIGEIKPVFLPRNFKELAKGVEFHTTLILRE